MSEEIRGNFVGSIFTMVCVCVSVLYVCVCCLRAESARLYGIDFYSVLSRGSQYRVEAVMLRVAHRQG